MRCLGIVTALMAEAVPIIDYYRLQKQDKREGYHYFTSEQITLLVCGMGAQRMKAGLNAYFSDMVFLRPPQWLNIGIAGAQSSIRGSAAEQGRLIQRV